MAFSNPSFLANTFAGHTQDRDTVKPNIIFILTDDYASNLVDFMPNLKAMQREGVTFSNYYVSNSLCCRAVSPRVKTGPFKS